jgi:hypothetical protein
MLHDLRLGVEFFAMLAEFDARIARQVAAAGCRHCGGPLHQGNYERKPRGVEIAAAGEAFSLRHSLCCGWDGCRKRTLPPSLRFLGRRVYLGAVVLLASVVALVAPALRVARALTLVPELTLHRWGTWWRTAFPDSPTWVELRARFRPPPPDQALLPSSLVVRLGADLAEARGDPSLGDICEVAARLLAPVTTRSVPDCARFVRGALAPLGADAFAQKMSFSGRFGTE